MESVELNYVIQKHRARRAGIHLDFRIQYPKKPALASFAIAKKDRFPEFSVKFLVIRTPDHGLEWLDWTKPIEKGNYGAGTFEIIQKGKLQIEGWSNNHITFKIDGPKIKGRYTLIRAYGRKSKTWFLIKTKKQN